MTRLMRTVALKGYTTLLVGVLLSFATVTSAEEDPAWQIVCPDQAAPDNCHITQQLFLSQTVDGQPQTVGRILKLTVLYAQESEGNGGHT